MGLLAFCQQSIKLIQVSSLKCASLEIFGAAGEDFQKSISKIRKISASVMREMEYLNRGRLWGEIYPHTRLFPDLTLSYTGVQREL
jgi:hypothetical protein